MPRIGVFICWCGSNIAGTVDIARVVEATAEMPHVAHVEDNKYTCSEPGQASIRKAIAEHNLDRVVVAACSPRMHENTFRKTIAAAGLNPYLLEIANLREHCSWVHENKDEATPKAIDLVRMAVAKVARHTPLKTSSTPVTRRAVVIGGGIAGIQAALDIADAGHEVVLVERTPSLGGHMAQLDKTFPTLDCSACILTPKMVEAVQHPKITIYAYSEIEKVDGYVGNFTVTVRRKARSVDETRCTGCGVCMTKCPAKVPNEFDMGIGTRRAIYVPFPQAVPNKATIDREHCIYYQRGRCKICERFCEAKAIVFDQPDELTEVKAGAIVAATGYAQFDDAVYGEYGYGKYPDVITGLEFERLVCASGPTEGKIKRPSDGKIPKTVVFVKCVGSRDENKGVSYCSRTCCMYTAKHAILTREKIPGSRVFVFYMDVRTAGKGYEEFYRRATEEYGARYVRGRVSRIYPKGDRLVVVGEDTILGCKAVVEADMVVLAAAMVSQADAGEVARRLGVSYDQDGFLTEAHPKLRPVETNTAGIFLAGACQGPKDIPDTVAQAGAAASKAAALLNREALETEAMIAQVDEARCSGCLWCESICPYKAIGAKTIQERIGRKTVSRTVAEVNPSLCHGCGACTVACRDGAMNLLGFTNQQILAEVEAACQS
jgi:heterodisulfide reductase subunit A